MKLLFNINEYINKCKFLLYQNVIEIYFYIAQFILLFVQIALSWLSVNYYIRHIPRRSHLERTLQTNKQFDVSFVAR